MMNTYPDIVLGRSLKEKKIKNPGGRPTVSKITLYDRRTCPIQEVCSSCSLTSADANTAVVSSS